MLTSSALQLFATFIGKNCGSGWREEGLAEKVLDEAAKSWKKSGGGVIVPGDGDELENILCGIESSMSSGRPLVGSGLDHSIGPICMGSTSDATAMRVNSCGHDREPNHVSEDTSTLSLADDEHFSENKDPRLWLKVVGAFDQPRFLYNANQKYFEIADTKPSLLPSFSHKVQLFRHRYNIIYQRLHRNESFQTSLVTAARSGSLQRSSSMTATVQQAYKLTLIANLLGRSGSNQLLLGLLSISPTGTFNLSDSSGSIGIDIQFARPVPEDGAWFAPGMIVLVDGVYEEQRSSAGPGLDGNLGVGGIIGGKFIAFSVGGPPCERREVTLGTTGSGQKEIPGGGGGFGWVDFLGVGSERAAGPAMRTLESEVFKRGTTGTEMNGRARIIILGEVQIDTLRSMQAVRKILGLYAAEAADQTPMVVALMGSFVQYAVMRRGGSGGSIEYKEYFDSLASTLSEYPTMLQNTTFVFVPSDNEPWASAFSAGAASVLPKSSIPEIFTSRVKRAFASANVEAERTAGRKTNGEAIWSTNPTRLTLFGPAQEIVLFRDNISSRLRRNSVSFRSVHTESAGSRAGSERTQKDDHAATAQGQKQIAREEVDTEVKIAESHIPAPKAKGATNSLDSTNLKTARKLVKTILDQGYMSPFPLSDRPVLWDYSSSLQLYPLPTAMVLMDPEAPPFAVTYEGCHVMNPGALTPGKRGVAQWMEYDAMARRGKTREIAI